MAFSAGVHYCFGAPLARLEAQTLLAGLLRRPALISAGEPRWAPGLVFRRIIDLPLSLGGASR
ncbi:putative cytochrome P450 hydroxylase [Actinacidiphila cocklensis]|uniref:Cytochrome P450 hydroxylase n=1 Tax=Actinacidiphila cocklensis TaxID=887465 RepID=A0A9W4DXE0_9ACTN|nr:putative cytochrome P450 hydroxylase [Actinacidiphila cocklensis]